LLQVLDEGQLTDSLGRKVDFRNTIIIMTSNIGARQLKDFGQGVGFSTSAKIDQASTHSRGVIENALKRAFAPEFLNRVDDVVVFNSLGKDEIFKIIDIELNSLFGRVHDLGYDILLTENAKEYIADKGFDANFGARPLKRAIQKYLEDPIAEEILKGELSAGDTMSIDYDKKTELISISRKKGEGKKKEKKSDNKEQEPKEEDSPSK
ncbi:MAG: ATP-dependent Clp protease ATP-binding subunit, partial [Pedobacter sp.]|nr:ATP-dependent Clp protease ATP-binding subunit [Pedobacter sp.]